MFSLAMILFLWYSCIVRREDMKQKILTGKLINGKIKVMGSIIIKTVDLTLPDWIHESRQKSRAV